MSGYTVYIGNYVRIALHESNISGVAGNIQIKYLKLQKRVDRTGDTLSTSNNPHCTR